MKRIILSAVAIAALTLSTYAQSPESMKYQSVVRDASANVIANQAVGMQFTILQGSITGTSVYQETFAPTTNAYGLVNLELGTGTIVSGDFTTIDWSAGPYFIETALDASGGSTYIVMGTSPLLSVPYALHAKTAETAMNVTNDLVDDADADSTNELNATVILNGTDLETTDAGGTITTDLSALVNDADADSTNELNTTVILNGTNLETADAGGTITTDLSSLINDADADSTNELNTTVILNGTNLETTDAGGTITTDLSSLINDVDADSTNELNTTVILNGTDLETTDAGGTITTDLSSLINDVDADSTNELNTTVILNGTDLETTDAGGTITTDLSSLINDADTSITNEIQNLSFVESTNVLTISAGNSVTLKAPCAFLVKRSVNTLIAAGQNVLTFNQEVYDLGNNFAGSAFIAPTAGVYAFHASVQHIVAAGKDYGMVVFKNNAYYQSLNYVRSYGTQRTNSGSFSLYLNAGERIYLKFEANAASIIYGFTTNFNTSFSGYRVH